MLSFAWCDALDAGIFNRYSPVKVMVLDAETDTAISGATVSVEYMGVFPFGMPKGPFRQQPMPRGKRRSTLRPVQPMCLRFGNRLYGLRCSRCRHETEGLPSTKAAAPHITIVVPRDYRGP